MQMCVHNGGMMIRVTFYADDEDDKSLEYISAKEGVPKAWMMREAIKEYLQKKIKEKRGE